MTPVQPDGVFHEVFNPLALAISLGASFVARAFAGDTSQTKDILKKAISHKDYALVDILQPCVTYNKLNTYQWFKANTYMESGKRAANAVFDEAGPIEEIKIPGLK